MRRKRWKTFDGIKVIKIRPRIPVIYDKKLDMLSQQTGLPKGRLLTSAIYIYLSYLSKKIKEGKDLLSTVVEIDMKTKKNLELLNKKR